mgnify:CR=1 FL=1
MPLAKQMWRDEPALDDGLVMSIDLLSAVWMSLSVLVLRGAACMLMPAGPAAGQTDPDATTTTAPGPAEGGTSPWVLVIIGMGLGALVGVLTGLARRRRAERELGRR